MSSTTNKVGETCIANNGLKMTIINYRNDKDIDVLFENDVIVYHKTYLSFKRGTIKLPIEEKSQVAILLDGESKQMLKEYSKLVGKSSSDIINTMIKLNCKDFSQSQQYLFGTYGNDVSYIKNFDYNLFSNMSREEFVRKYVDKALEEIQVSLFHYIAPKCINIDYGNVKDLYFSSNSPSLENLNTYTSMLLDLFNQTIFNIEDIVKAIFGENSNEHYLVHIYNKLMTNIKNDLAECWKESNMYDYGVYIDEYVKQNPDGTYYTRLGSMFNILNYQGKEEETIRARKENYQRMMNLDSLTIDKCKPIKIDKNNPNVVLSNFLLDLEKSK